MVRHTGEAPTQAFRFDTADGLRDDVFSQLAAGVATSKHPLHLMAVATSGTDGRAEARYVVVRAFDPTARSLSFHADARSPKIADIGRDERLTLLLYDPDTRLQLRIAARATPHRDDERAFAGWISTAPTSRIGYAQPFAPGEALDANAVWNPPSEVSLDDPEARSRFVWIDCEIDTIDALWLNSTGNLRALLTWTGESWAMRRLGP